MNHDACIEDIHGFWFGRLDQYGNSDPAHRQLWFQSSAETDTTIEQRFGHLVKLALAGELDQWPQRERGLVAMVLLLDQFTRNIFRGTPQAFAGDAMALTLSRQAVAEGTDRALPTIHRVFLYLPFEHSEELAVQEQSVTLFESLREDCAPEMRDQLGEYCRYAVAHRDVIARFGRFPHRNAILGRTSSPEELQHLKTQGGF